jgi:hypothetical protein
MTVGHNASAKIEYGYDLGDPLKEWSFVEVDEDGLPSVPWYDGDEGFIGSLEERLKALDITGVEVQTYGHEYGAAFLSIARGAKTPAWGSVEIGYRLPEVGILAMERLTHAIEALGITPTGRMGWHLLTMYG